MEQAARVDLKRELRLGIGSFQMNTPDLTEENPFLGREPMAHRNA